MSPATVCYLFPTCPLLSRSIIASGAFCPKTFRIFSLMVRRGEPVYYDVPLFTDMNPPPCSFLFIYSPCIIVSRGIGRGGTGLGFGLWVGWFDWTRGAWVNDIGLVRVKLNIRNLQEKGGRFPGGLSLLSFYWVRVNLLLAAGCGIACTFSRIQIRSDSSGIIMTTAEKCGTSRFYIEIYVVS